jgi:hypothetical protein
MRFESSYNLVAQPHVVDAQLQALYRDRVQHHSLAGSILAGVLNELTEKRVPFMLTYDPKGRIPMWKLELDV